MTHYALYYGCSNSYRTTWMVYRYDGAYGWWSLTKNTYGYNQTTYVFYLNSHGGIIVLLMALVLVRSPIMQIIM